ncbi:MAG: histidine--tRNA ligase [Christensenellales bacterium]
MINIQKGTKDMLPKDSYKWHKVWQVIKEIARKYNLKEISTPVFESTDLFVRSDGNSSDIVNKEMYTFLDKGNRSITLKPEGTAGVVRSYIENGLGNEILPVKLYYLTPCYRYEKPQAGRLREHHQFGVELFGANSLASDIEAILIAYDFYKAFGINPTININFLGCDSCKAKYKEIIKNYVEPHLPEMCDDCHNRFKSNPLRMLDCKSPVCKKILEEAPKMSDCLCEKCKTKFDDIKKMFNSLGIKYVHNSKLVRGLDYYTDLVFEFVDEDITLGQNALGGGGRYDNLVAELGGKSTPVIGFGIGIERLLLYLENKGIEIGNNENLDVYVASNTDNENYIIKFVSSLRRKGFSVESNLMDRSLKAQFKYADKIKAKFVLVIGDDEINENKISIKNMSTGEQIKVWSNDVAEYLHKYV